MRSKKSSIGIVILIAVLILGIGYAAISSKTLNITGNANAVPSDSNFVVKFTGTPETTKTLETSTVTATITNDLNATINVDGLTTTGDKATATYTILNDSPELSAALKVGTITNSNEEYFKVTADIAAPTTIEATATTTVTITVELIKTPIDNQAATITVPVVAEPVTK